MPLFCVSLPNDKLYVEENFINCILPQCQCDEFFLPLTNPLSFLRLHLPPSTFHTVGAQQVCRIQLLPKINRLDRHMSCHF